MPRFNLNCSIAVGAFLGDGGRLDILQRILREHAPRWSSAIHVRRPRKERATIDLERRGSLEKAVLERAQERGAVFQALSAEHGAGTSRVFGQAELGGCDASLVVVVSVDENPLAQAGPNWTWGNRIVLQVCRSKVEGVAASVWSRNAFDALCGGLSPVHGHAELHEEYDAKNMIHDDAGSRAVGVDVRRHLPGIYWLNFFGRPYCDFIGAGRVLDAPAPDVRRVDAGVLVALGEDPSAWSSESYRDAESRVRSHLG